MKVKYISKHETPALVNGKTYKVISIEKGWYIRRDRSFGR